MHNAHYKYVTEYVTENAQSVLKAARVDASAFNKLDETGLDVVCCRHFHILRAVNMTKGETFKHFNYLHCFLEERNTKFVCLDVMCRYWPYAKKIMIGLITVFQSLKKLAHSYQQCTQSFTPGIAG